MRPIDADRLETHEQLEPLGNGNYEYVEVVYKDDIDNAPTIEPERPWIPCSERLPEAQTEVIVSCTDYSGDTKFRYTSSGWVTTNKEYWIVDNEINNFVVAWMPLPEPYEPQESEDEL